MRLRLTSDERADIEYHIAILNELNQQIGNLRVQVARETRSLNTAWKKAAYRNIADGDVENFEVTDFLIRGRQVVTLDGDHAIVETDNGEQVQPVPDSADGEESGDV